MIKRITLIILNMAMILVAILILAACAPTLNEQIQWERAQANKYHAQAAITRAEGDAAVQKAQAMAITTQAMAQADFQLLENKMIWLQQAEGSIIDNTFWTIVLLFIVLILLVAVLTIQAWQLTLLREVIHAQTNS